MKKRWRPLTRVNFLRRARFGLIQCAPPYSVLFPFLIPGASFQNAQIWLIRLFKSIKNVELGFCDRLIVETAETCILSKNGMCAAHDGSGSFITLKVCWWWFDKSDWSDLFVFQIPPIVSCPPDVGLVMAGSKSKSNQNQINALFDFQLVYCKRNLRIICCMFLFYGRSKPFYVLT